MTKRTNATARLMAALGLMAALVAAVSFSPSSARAEPILGQESLTAPALSEQKPEVTEALSRFRAKDYDRALELWQEAVKNDANKPPAQVIMAQLYLKANMPKEAQTALEQAVIENPADPEAFIMQASLALRDRKISKAESLYEKAGALAAAYKKSVQRKQWLQTQVLGGQAALNESRKDWPAARTVLDAWATLEPKNAAILQRIAYCLFQEKNINGALEKLHEAAKDNKDALTPEVVLGQFHEVAGDRKNAEKSMAAALVAAPKDLKTRLAVGQWALETQQLGEAQKHAIAATLLAPKSLEAKLFRGVTALFQKDYAAAESIFDSAVKQSPQNVVATNNLALALVAQDDSSKGNRALEYAEANAKQFPTSPEIASTYGLVLYKLGRLDEAAKMMLIAAPLATTDIDTAYIVARISADRGRKADAKKLLEIALKNTKPFMFRQDAEELLAELEK